MLQVAPRCRPLPLSLARSNTRSHIAISHYTTHPFRYLSVTSPSISQQFRLIPVSTRSEGEGHAPHLTCDDSYRGLCLHIRPPLAACRLITGSSNCTLASTHHSALSLLPDFAWPAALPHRLPLFTPGLTYLSLFSQLKLKHWHNLWCRMAAASCNRAFEAAEFCAACPSLDAPFFIDTRLRGCT
jgi:hypothetical protein